MAVLVTGGAGYIGAHVVRLLRERGDDVVVADDLSTGELTRLDGVPLVEVDLSHPAATRTLRAAMSQHAVDAVIHIAAKKQVGESAARPAWYYEQNVGGHAHLLQAMEAAGVDRLMFSSSAATYGLPDIAPGTAIDETAQPRPISPDGETKLVCEGINRGESADRKS